MQGTDILSMQPFVHHRNELFLFGEGNSCLINNLICTFSITIISFNDKLIGQDISSFEVSFDAKTSYLYRLMPANTYGLDPTPPVDPDNPIDPNPDNPIVPHDKSSNLLFPIIGTSIAGIEIVSMVAILIVTLKIKKAK